MNDSKSDTIKQSWSMPEFPEFCGPDQLFDLLKDFDNVMSKIGSRKKLPKWDKME